MRVEHMHDSLDKIEDKIHSGIQWLLECPLILYHTMDPWCFCTLQGPLVLHTLSEEKIENPDNTVTLMGQAIMLCWNFSVWSLLCLDFSFPLEGVLSCSPTVQC
jgi:hypothetical protein